MVNFVICDDNHSFLLKLEKILESLFIKRNVPASVVLTAKSSNEVMEYIDNNKVDVLILDIDLKSSLSGIELAREVRKINKNIYIIFITGHLEYILQAYKVKTFDYLPKPITAEKVEETIARLFNDINIPSQNYISISNKVLLNTNDILFIKKDGMKMTFHTSTKEYHNYISLSKIKHMLPENFVRCHKSYIINVDKISNIDYQNNSIYLKSATEQCFIGPTYKTKFMEVMNNEKFNTINNTVNNT